MVLVLFCNDSRVYFLFHIARRVEGERDILIDPPNIITNPVKKGASIDKVLFSAPSYNAVGEPFKTAGASIVTRNVDKNKVTAAGHENQFKPARTVKEPVVAAYEHMQELNHIPKNYKSDENPREVISGPRNFITNPPKKGQSGKQTYFEHHIPYTEDDYNRPKALAREEHEKHVAKLQDAPFR